jgi:hypothetical protein
MCGLFTAWYGLPIFALVKKWIAYILCLYIMFSAVVPCSIFDKCEEIRHTEQASKSFPVKDCNNCSPFSVCAAAHGFTITHENFSIETFAFNSPLFYNEYDFSSKPGYYFSHFQPPRGI